VAYQQRRGSDEQRASASGVETETWLYVEKRYDISHCSPYAGRVIPDSLVG